MSVARNHRRRSLFIILSILIILGLVAGYAFKIEPRLLAVRRVTVASANLPENWEGRKVAFFSDVHIGRGYTPELLAKAVAAMAQEQPDLVLFGGDMVDNHTPLDQTFSAEVGAILAEVQAPYGKFAIPGNHDNRLRAELQAARTMLETGGFTMLTNEVRVIDGIQLGGLDESYFGKPDFEKTFSDLPDDQFRLVLMHQPDYLPAQQSVAMDLILSGHSHRGQVTLFGRPIFTVYQGRKYPYGAYKLDERRQLYVSGGLGTVAVNARLFARPEVVIITLTRVED